jgi:two-component system, NarL family, sensor kinase
MKETNFVLYILASISFMLAFAIAVVWFLNHAQKKIVEQKIKQKDLELQFQSDLLVNTVKTQENERDRIAKELHDDIASKLNIVHLNVQRLKEVIPKNSESTQMIDFIEMALRQSTERTREISHELMPPLLNKFGINHTLTDLVHSIEIFGKISITLKNDYLIKISDQFKLLHLYRIIQELINNTIKHAQASKILISFEEREDNLIMIYADDGIGYDQDVKSGTLGMNNILTRTKLLDGNIDIITSKNQGFKVYIKFPNHD